MIPTLNEQKQIGPLDAVGHLW